MEHIPIYEVVYVCELGDISWTGGGDVFAFRIEILGSKNPLGGNQYYANVYRRERFQIQPTFPQEDGVSSLGMFSHRLLVTDHFLIDWDRTNSDTVTGALEKVLTAIRNQFGVTIGE